MKQFYLSKNSRGYYRVHFIDPVTGKQKSGKSTHVKNRDEALVIATYWLQNGVPEAQSNSRAFYNSTYKMEFGPNGNPLTIPCAPKYKLCQFLLDFWDYDNSEFIRQYLAYGHTISKKHTLNMKAYVKNYYQPYFGTEKQIELITKKELNDFFYYLKTSRNLAGETVNKIINCASRATRWLYENEMIMKNPFHGIDRFKAENQKRGIPTEYEVKKLLELNWENPTAKLAFKLAALFGLRAGEISGLRVCDIDMNAAMIHVRHSWSEVDGLKSTKNNDTRDLPLDHLTILQLMNQARRNPEYNELSYVFYQPKNPKTAYYPGYYGDVFYLALEKIGVTENERKERNMVFHSLRHFCATILAQRADLKIVQAILGHRTEAMSEHYADHESQEKFENIRLIMSDAWKNFTYA